FFFFQAEDGIRDGHVTGVQTCALPIYVFDINRSDVRSPTFGAGIHYCLGAALARAEMEETLRFLVERFERLSLSDTPRWIPFHRSEERRVGKECRSRVWS